MSTPKLTEAQRHALNSIANQSRTRYNMSRGGDGKDSWSWGHPAWIRDVYLELEDMGLLSRHEGPGSRVTLAVTDAGRTALRGES